MATPGRTTRAALAESLKSEAHRFDFFQAVRVLEALARDVPTDSAATSTRPVGYDALPAEELVRFRALASYTFAQSDVHSYRERVPGQKNESELPPNLNVSFLGLFGPKGALPRHFTRSVMERNDEKDYVLRDFLDLFNHRAISLFYRAWEKNRLPAAFERAQRSSDRRKPTDLFTQCLLSLVGFGTKDLPSRQEVDDQAFLYYAGHFGRGVPSALALEQVLSDYFSFPVKIQQLQGEWLNLTVENQSSLGASGLALGGSGRRNNNNRLGLETIAGERVWTVECKFRIVIGPIGYAEFERLMPQGDDLVRLAQLVRSFVGPTLAFEIQPILRAEEAPECELTPPPVASQQYACSGAKLGYNTWLFSERPQADVSDAVFTQSGGPTRG